MLDVERLNSFQEAMFNFEQSAILGGGEALCYVAHLTPERQAFIERRVRAVAEANRAEEARKAEAARAEETRRAEEARIG